MPGTIVKLSSGHARAWAHNQPVWLTESGETERAVTRSEQHAISRALERTARVNRSFRLDLLLEDIVPTPNGFVRRRLPPGKKPGATAPQKITCAFEVQVVATKRVVTVWLGNLRYATGREVIAAQLLADHGECVMHGRNGKCLGVLRDPLASEREPNYGRRMQYSSTAEERQAAQEQIALDLEAPPVVAPVQQRRGQPLTRVRPGSRPSTPTPHAVGTRLPARPLSRPLPRPSPRPAARAVAAPAQPRVYSPAQCPNDCRGHGGGQAWSLAKDAMPPTAQEHHPVCKHARAWSATLHLPETTSVLYDLELGKVMRGAMPEEIAEAEIAERTTTMRNITVGDRLYAVLTLDEAELAAQEARGESPTLPPLRALSEAPEPLSLPDDSEEQTEPLNSAELRSMLDSPFEPESADLGDDAIEDTLPEDVDRYLGDLDAGGQEKPTDRAPPPRAPVAAIGRQPMVHEETEPDVSSSSEAERDDWPTLGEVQGQPEDYRQRAEVTASRYLARSPQIPPSSNT